MKNKKSEAVVIRPPLFRYLREALLPLISLAAAVLFLFERLKQSEPAASLLNDNGVRAFICALIFALSLLNFKKVKPIIITSASISREGDFELPMRELTAIEINKKAIFYYLVLISGERRIHISQNETTVKLPDLAEIIKLKRGHIK